MKLAIMQPYLFPYIGYFQLINAVDKFIIYDDVNFIKQGWINRNRILINNEPHYFTINLVAASSFKKISEIEVDFNREKVLKTIYQAYRRAPHFNNAYMIIEDILCHNDSRLSNFVFYSITQLVRLLGIKTELVLSSESRLYPHETGTERILSICKHNSAKMYINAIGGIDLYDKDNFQKHNIELKFLKSRYQPYKQFSNKFENHLSIIDVVMFNSLETVKYMLEEYELI